MECSKPRSPAKPWLCDPEGGALVWRTSDAKLLGMSCWVPIFRATGLLVLRTMEGAGEMDGESDGEEILEEEEACLVSWEDADSDV